MRLAEEGIAIATSPQGPRKAITELEIPWRTFMRVLLLLGTLWLLLRLWQIGLLLILAVMLAAALDPAVRWLQRRGFPRTLAVAGVILSLTGAIALTLLRLIPPLIDEGRDFAAALQERVEDYRGILEENEEVYTRLQNAAQSGSANPGAIFGGFLEVGQTLITGITNALLLLVLTVYILVDGPRIYAWCTRYLTPNHREKLDRTIPEVSSVVSGYVLGQLLTSALFGVFTFVVLTALGVPQPLFLALIAAIADAIPIAGVLIATVPAALLALTVSPFAAGAVVVAYIVYQQIENYVIVPRVYRSTLQISSFAVLIAVLIGGSLLGILGVLLALPTAAAIPVIERIWMEKRPQV